MSTATARHPTGPGPAPRPARQPAPRRAPQPARRPTSRRSRRRPGEGALAGAVAASRSGRRLRAFLGVYLCLSVAMGWRLVTVQVLDADTYRGLAERQTQREITLPAHRGRLLDRDGGPLALSLEAATVYANPRVIADGPFPVETVARALAPLVGRDLDDVRALLVKDASFVYLVRQAPREVGERIEQMALPGIGVLSEPKREYPTGDLAAPVVGFAGTDNTGLSGLELQYDEVLAGQAGTMWLERAPGGLDINTAPRVIEQAAPGRDVVLTIDRQVQFEAERLLREAIVTYEAKGAAAVVMDARTGEVVAMASNTVGQNGGGANRTVTDVFEPGSVNKVITAAAAMEEGVVGASEVFSVPDHWVIGPKRFKDSSPHEDLALTFSEIIARSSNVGTIQVAQRLGDARMNDYVRRFGYGRPTGLGFPNESAGLLPAVETWSVLSLPTIAIGQGVSATLVQVANVFATIAHDGEWVAPTLVRGTIGPDGVMEPAPAPERHRAVSEATADAVARMLVGVVEGEGGTGHLAAVPGYSVGGKTGTAQKPSRTMRGYEPGAYIGSFVGFAPVEDPAYVIGVILDEPTPIYGGVTAALVFSDLMAFALAHGRVPPTRATADPVPAVVTVPTPPTSDRP